MPASVCGSPDDVRLRFRHFSLGLATDPLRRIRVLVGENISVHLMKIWQELISPVDYTSMSIREISTAKGYAPQERY